MDSALVHPSDINLPRFRNHDRDSLKETTSKDNSFEGDEERITTRKTSKSSNDFITPQNQLTHSEHLIEDSIDTTQIGVDGVDPPSFANLDDIDSFQEDLPKKTFRKESVFKKPAKKESKLDPRKSGNKTKTDLPMSNESDISNSQHSDFTLSKRPSRRLRPSKFTEGDEELDRLLGLDSGDNDVYTSLKKEHKANDYFDDSDLPADEYEEEDDDDDNDFEIRSSKTRKSMASDVETEPKKKKHKGKRKESEDKTSKIDLVLSRANKPSVLKSRLKSSRAEGEPEFPEFPEFPTTFKEAKPLLSLKSIISIPPRARPNTTEKSVSLLKKRLGEKQRPLLIDVQRLLTDSTRDKRLRVNTLDVVQQLIKNFEPKLHKNRFLDEQAIHNDFKAHFLSQLESIGDVHGSIKDLHFDVTNIQKQKNDMRRKIFELKKDHSKVGNDLNQLRSQYNKSKEDYESFTNMSDQLCALNKSISKHRAGSLNDMSGESESIENELTEDVDEELASLSKIIDPQSGIYKKLTMINEKLSKVDHEL